jgi:hypothetical protein
VVEKMQECGDRDGGWRNELTPDDVEIRRNQTSLDRGNPGANQRKNQTHHPQPALPFESME